MFQKIGLKAKVDLFVGCVNGVTIYEAKAGKTKALDLYQLRMYVDGCALDNKPVDEAVLIAKRHSAEVKELRDILNTLTAPDGRPYKFSSRGITRLRYGSFWTSSMGCPRLMAVPTISGWSHGMRRGSSCSRARD